MLQFSLESSGRLATVYIAGSVSLPGLWQILDRCDQLSPDIRSLRIDMHGVRLMQPGVLEGLTVGLRQWRDAREGTTRMDLPEGGLGNRIVGAPIRNEQIQPSP